MATSSAHPLTIKFDIIKAQNAGFIDGLDITFAAEGAYDRNITLASGFYGEVTITLEKDEDNNILLRSDNQIWAGTILGKTYKNPFVSISNGDKIRVEGEKSSEISKNCHQFYCKEQRWKATIK